MNLKRVSNDELVNGLKRLIQIERKTTSEILEYIREVDSRRLYLKLGHTSLFSYLTRALGYTPASAQRRIEAARLMNSVPEVAGEIAAGTLNLSQVSLMAQGLREQTALVNENPAARLKIELMEKIRGCDIESTQKIVAQTLNIAPVTFEKKRVQRDESLRLEITFTKEQRDVIDQAKGLLSHVDPHPNWAELFVLPAKDSIKMRDPLARKSTHAKSPLVRAANVGPTINGRVENISSIGHASGIQLTQTNKCRTRATAPVALPCQNSKPDQTAPQVAQSLRASASQRRPIPAAVKRFVFQRDKCCQWRDPNSGHVCGSKFQLQLDHIFPVRAGGPNTTENLQLLCSAHNRHKYETERN